MAVMAGKLDTYCLSCLLKWYCSIYPNNHLFHLSLSLFVKRDNQSELVDLTLDSSQDSNQEPLRPNNPTAKANGGGGGDDSEDGSKDGSEDGSKDGSKDDSDDKGDDEKKTGDDGTRENVRVFVRIRPLLKGKESGTPRMSYDGNTISVVSSGRSVLTCLVLFPICMFLISCSLL